MNKSIVNVAIFGFLAWLIVACTAIGLQKPETFTEKLAYAHSTVNAIVGSTTSALNRHAISSGDATYISRTAVDTRAILEEAETTYSAGDISTGEGRLTLAISVLTQLEDYLVRHGEKK